MKKALAVLGFDGTFSVGSISFDVGAAYKLPVSF